MASDGDVGEARDFYFDDERWTVRYLVVDADALERPRQVLITPMSITDVDWVERKVTLSVTRNQLAKSPEVDTHMPVSRQREIEFHRHYGYPYYWGGVGLWGPGVSPMALASLGAGDVRFNRERRQQMDHDTAQSLNDSHLRSTWEVIRYHVNATDGEVGRIDDFLVDDETWELQHAVVDTRNWWPGKKVLIEPESIEGIDWHRSTVSIGVDRQTIKIACAYYPDAQMEQQRRADYRLHH